MKYKLYKLFALIFALVLIFNLSGCGVGASGNNVKIDSVLPDCVIYYPVCPECGHISTITSKNLSEGDEQEYKGQYMCEICYKIYEISIKRK